MSRQYRIRACVISDIGRQRSNHEDNYLLDDGRHITDEQQRKISGDRAGPDSRIFGIYPRTVKSNCIFAVSDGMGGHNAGETASLIAVEQLFNIKEYIFKTPDAEGIKSRFQDYIMKANTVITLKAGQNPELKGMGATLTGILLCEEGVIPFNLGDSRTYLFDGDKLEQVTKDHTEGQRLLDYGIIKENELSQVDGAKGITRYLGIDDKYMIPQADTGGTLRIGGRYWFLICSDGLTDILEDSEIKGSLTEYYSAKDLEQAVKKLVDKVLEDKEGRSGGIDNITVLLFEVEEYTPKFIDRLKIWK